MSSSSDDVRKLSSAASTKGTASQDAAALVAGTLLSAGVGIWLGRKRRQRRSARSTVLPVQARPATETSAQPPLPSGLERALRLVTLALPLVAAWRRGTARAKLEDRKSVV